MRTPGTEGQEPSTISAALRLGRQRMAASGSETPALDAEVLLRHVLRVDRTELFARLPDPVEPSTLSNYSALLEQRASGTPVAYLTGAREFMELPFVVTPAVLVPRPETEILVEWALRWLGDRGASTVADIGTGSGAIALSIAARMGVEWPGRVIASDISADALAVAARNRDRLAPKARIDFAHGSLLDWGGEPIDLLLANLPYLRPAQIAENPELEAEPRLALDGGDDGLALVRQLLQDAPSRLAPGGAAGLEIDPAQRDAVVALAHGTFPGASVSVLHDLAGHARHIIIETASKTAGRPGTG